MLQRKVQEGSAEVERLELEGREVEEAGQNEAEVLEGLQEADEFEQEGDGQLEKGSDKSHFPWHRRRRRRRADFCGYSYAQVNAILAPPPEVQRIMRFMLGTSYGVNTPTTSPCTKLPLDAKTQYIIIIVGKSLLQGIEAEDKKAEVARNAGKTEDSSFKQAVNILSDQPFCVALRFCDKGDVTAMRNSWLKVWDFGFYTDAGVVIYQAGPVSLKFMGLAFSSAGNLQVGKMDAPIWGYGDGELLKVTTNLHWWFKMTAAFPVGKQKKVSAEIAGTLGAYAELDGDADIAPFLLNMLGEQDGTIEGLIKSAPKKFLFRVLGGVEATLSFDLLWLFGKKAAKDGDEPKTFKLVAYASLLREAQFHVGNPKESFLAQYFSLKVELNLSELLKVSQFVKDLFNGKTFKAMITADAAFFMKATQSLDFSAGFRIGMQAEMSCGFLKAFPDEVMDAFPLLKKLKEICGQKLETSLELVGVDNQLSMERTCFTILSNKYCLSDLPSCPPPVGVGGKCSLNSDCKGTAYGSTQQGYCKSQNALRTTTFCTGKCEKLAKAGESCSAASTNTWNLATSAENEKCEAHWQGTKPACLCATCTDKGGRLPDGTKCATDANCKSGYCHKGGVLETIANQGCRGTCKARKSNGHGCSYDAECHSRHCSAGCRDLFNCVTNGKCVQCLDHNHCGSEQYCDGHSCHNKKEYLEGTDKHWKCKSGRDVCGRCAHTNGLVYGGYRCSVDGDCGWGWRCGHWWSNCWGCRCTCR